MFTILMVFHVLVCFLLIIVVLMQSAKGEGLAGGTAFGGAMSGAVFGGRGAATFLTKATTVLAVVFMLNCGALAFMSSDRIVATDGSQATESVVGRKMSEEQDRYLEQQRQAEERARQDSIAQESGTSIEDLMQEAPATPPDSN
ncbi:MAG: preprotein translocase subunit SecG [Candidatus Zixiibacteriota bacterium]|nr:MAG: preprotein translocase subunit SecG [candidate division Zixibacteria bacterium]